MFAAFAASSAFVSIAAAQESQAATEHPDATAEAVSEPETPAPEGEAAVGAAGAEAGVPVASGKESGFELGARLGWGFPLGDVEDDYELSEFILGQIPLQLDLGYRLNPQLFLGGYFMYGIAFAERAACGDSGEDFDCSASDVRLGIQGIYHFTPITEGSAGWVGAGVGYEWASLTSGDGAPGEVTFRLDGFEFVNIQGGYDFRVSDQFRVGPYGMFTLAQFSNQSTEVNGSERESDADKVLHQWLFVGVKGSFGPL
jgi:hypothetical protein